MTELTGKTAVVIGGTHGMGFSTVQSLVQRGARVLLTGSREPNLERARRELGPDVLCRRCDLRHLPDIDALADSARRELGTLDLVFVNAGHAVVEPIAAVQEASYDEIFAINAKGAFFAAQRLAPMIRDGGALLFTSVSEAATGTPEMSVYMGAKAAVRAFAKVFAAELAPRNVRVNCIGPGFVRTKTMGIAGASDEERQELEQLGNQLTPLRRNGTPEEVARAALFLAFDATFTTAIELAVDGGLSRIEAPHPAQTTKGTP